MQLHIDEFTLKHPGVLDVKSSFVLEAVKETTALPIAARA